MSARIVIVGAGAIGGYFGAHMARAGLDVTLIDAWPEHVEKVRRDGMTVEGLSGERFTVPADIRHIGDVQGFVRERPIDIAFIAVKSYDTLWATQLVVPYLADDGVVVSLQNAINEGAIASIAGARRTYGCAINALACELVGPAHVRRMSPKGDISVGAVEGADPARCAEIAAALDHAEASKPIGNLIGVKWSKLVINSMRNGLSAMTGMTGRERDSDPVTMALGMRLGGQAVRIGRALGYPLVNTGFDFDTLVAAERGDAGAIDAIRLRMAEIAGARSGDQRPSMAQDIGKGRRTETDAINGFIAQKGRDVGIDATPHGRVHQLILRIERGELQPSPELARGII
ncbi:ketopantoate reductase family protein [Arvimicrobium flavum]|uniref:ketopantoate reductase family protein n=1 Tax=Arvimicrobium flavum TaxID=3393320 RepID=UPI00237C2BD3|nr:2-dehydropantoate 2-reductase [Mesorhizobium shangrilense]